MCRLRECRVAWDGGARAQCEAISCERRWAFTQKESRLTSDFLKFFMTPIATKHLVTPAPCYPPSSSPRLAGLLLAVSGSVTAGTSIRRLRACRSNVAAISCRLLRYSDSSLATV